MTKKTRNTLFLLFVFILLIENRMSSPFTLSLSAHKESLTDTIKTKQQIIYSVSLTWYKVIQKKKKRKQTLQSMS